MYRRHREPPNIFRLAVRLARWAMGNDPIEGPEWGAYVALGRCPMTERGIAYGTRVLGRRSFRRSRGSHAPPGRTGEPSTGRRETGGRAVQRERVRDARKPEPSGCSSTGELIDAETVTISSERGSWKSACQGNSLAAYSTLTSGSEGGGWKRAQPVSRKGLRTPAQAETSPAAYPTLRPAVGEVPPSRLVFLGARTVARPASTLRESMSWPGSWPRSRSPDGRTARFRVPGSLAHAAAFSKSAGLSIPASASSPRHDPIIMARRRPSLDPG